MTISADQMNTDIQTLKEQMKSVMAGAPNAGPGPTDDGGRLEKALQGLKDSFESTLADISERLEGIERRIGPAFEPSAQQSEHDPS